MIFESVFRNTSARITVWNTRFLQLLNWQVFMSSYKIKNINRQSMWCIHGEMNIQSKILALGVAWILARYRRLNGKVDPDKRKRVH